MASGHGISDAVRGAIKDWMTAKVIEILYQEARSRGLVSDPGTNVTADYVKQSSFSSKLRTASEWVRIKRCKTLKADVWQRTYYSKLFGRDTVGLTVLTNKAKDNKPEDMYIEYVTITLGKVVIGGGKVSIPSMNLSQKGRSTKIQDLEFSSLFAEFDQKELDRLTAEMQFGEDSMFFLLEEERIA